jgi:hypothetical protein
MLAASPCAEATGLDPSEREGAILDTVMRVLSSIVVLALAVCPLAARADALEPPPTDCPDGSLGASSRRGSHCEHAPCDGACASASSVCSTDEVAVCVETLAFTAEDVEQGPRIVSVPAERWQVVHGPCDASGACARGSCVRHRACVPEGSPHASSCAAGGTRHGEPAALFVSCLVALAALGRSRRRSLDAS